MADGDAPKINRHTAHYRANAAFRGAQRALRKAGIDPRTVPALESLRGKGHVEDWPAIVGLSRGPGKRFAVTEQPVAPPPPQSRDPAPWGGYVGEQPQYLRPVGLWLDFDRACSTPYLRRLVHGVVSTLVGRNHDARFPAWSLVPQATRRWGVILYDPADAERLRGTDHQVPLGADSTTVRVSREAIRLRTPPALAPGRYRVTLDAVTEVINSHTRTTTAEDGAERRRKVPVEKPTATTVYGAVSLALQMAGVTALSRLHFAQVEARTERRWVRFGFVSAGAIRGWVGRLVIDCNAPAAWALQVAAQIGFGGKCAFGLGRVRVQVERVGEP